MLTSSIKLNNCQFFFFSFFSPLWLCSVSLGRMAVTVTVAVFVTMTVAVTVAVIMIMTVSMVGRCKQSLACVPVGHVGKDSVLDVAA